MFALSSVYLNFAVPPLFPFLFSVRFLPDALRSPFVQAEIQLCEKLSNLQMENLSLSRLREVQACTLVRVWQVGEDRDSRHCFELFRLGSERDASNVSLSGKERLPGWEVWEYRLRPSVGADGA